METGYLKVFCDVLLEELEKLPGDSRTHIGFLTYDRVVHFYSLPDGATQPTQLTVCDIDGKFIKYRCGHVVRDFESEAKTR